MKRIIIIDGNSLLFRAYYATAYSSSEIMRNKEGVPTNAIFAFSNMMNKIVSSLKEGDSIFVAFDAAKHNFRHDALETYKANRKPAPSELVEQFPIARDFLKSFGIFQFEEEGFEGDDIAGTVAKKAKQEGYDVTIYTSDRDFLQLVDDKISVNIIKKGLSDVALMTPESVKEAYGFEPLKIIDYKGLRGDLSDNLPGIPGIGEKTAVKLIQEYGSFDNIVAHKDEYTAKIKKAIEENENLGRISRDLAIIKTDIELPFDISDTTYQGYSFNSINEFCQKYELKQFMNKISSKWKKGDSLAKKIEVEMVDSFAGLDLGEEIGLALDFVDSDDYARSEILGLAISNKEKIYYIEFDNLIKDENLLGILKNPNIHKHAYDYKAIKVSLHNQGIDIEGLAFDLLIASYLLDSSLKNSPESILHFYGVDFSKSEDDQVSLFSNNNPQNTGELAYYSLSLKGKVKSELVKYAALDLFENLELPLVDTLANMEIEGFPLDVKVVDELGDVYEEKLKELSAQIYAIVGEEFNLASPKQLGEILFNKLGLPNRGKGSTSVDNLKDLADKHPVIPLIIEYRKYFKIVSTYINGLKPHIYPDGKIHAYFNQAQTQTGRLSSSNPNLQNISVRNEEGKLIRKAFHYPNNEYKILSLDYSQIELRILAHLSNCPNLISTFLSGEDIHKETAKRLFETDSPTSDQRRKAKTVNFGIIYGISDWGLSEQLEIPVKESKEIINNFYKAFPEVSIFFQQVINNALKDGYVSTMLGRRRYLRELHDSNYAVREFAKRAAMNAPIQGSAADLIKIAMIKVEKAIKEKNLKSKMVLQIHDELLFKVAKGEEDILYKTVNEVMTHALELNVPLQVDGGFGDTWYDCK